LSLWRADSPSDIRAKDTVTVKLAQEVKGEIVRVKGAVPQRLLQK